jgi:hypothetical protein
MEDQRVPNLKEMDEEQARQFLTQLYLNLSRRRIQRAPPSVRDGNASVRRALPGAGEHAGVPESPRQPCHPAAVSPVAPGAGQGGTVGCRGGNRLRRRAGIRRGAAPRAVRWKDVARSLVLRRAVRGAGVAGAVGRADGNLSSRHVLAVRGGRTAHTAASEALDRPDPEALSDEIAYDAWRYSERPLSLLLRVFHPRDVCAAKPLFCTVCQVAVVSESGGYERCGPYLHLHSRSTTESTPRSCPAVRLEEPQDGLDRSQLP